jgi:hypothetical protein
LYLGYKRCFSIKHKEFRDMKSVILMTTAIFLASAPSPDAKTIAEVSGGFLSPSTETALSAAEASPKALAKSEAEDETNKPVGEQED